MSLLDVCPDSPYDGKQTVIAADHFYSEHQVCPARHGAVNESATRVSLRLVASMLRTPRRPPLSRLPDDSLENDWQQVAHSALLTARFRARRAKQPALARFPDAAALLRFMRGPGSRVEKDAVLCALLAWAKDESIGARVVLEAIRPGLLNLSARIMRDAREREELRSTMYLAVWEGIRRYPLARRPRRVAANLLLDTMHRTLVELGRHSGAPDSFGR